MQPSIEEDELDHDALSTKYVNTVYPSILIVDDNDFNIFSLKCQLEHNHGLKSDSVTLCHYN